MLLSCRGYAGEYAKIWYGYCITYCINHLHAGGADIVV